MRINIILAGLLLHLSVTAIAQQHKHFRGSLTYTLGPDTSAVGIFELNGNAFALTVVSMSPAVNVSKLTGTFFPDGEIQHLEGINYDPTKRKDSLLYAYKLSYLKDTTIIETQSKARGSTHRYPVKIMVANNLGGDAIVFMPALLAAFAPERAGDSIISNHIVFSSPRKFIIKRAGDHKLLMGSAVMGMFTIYLDGDGGLRSVDGIGTSFNIKGAAGPYLNIDSVIASNISHQQLHPKLAIINKFDSVKAVINATDINITYSRPSVRGRVIFGQVVPWGRIWRTGADGATKITISKPLYFDDKELPAGSYSIFTLPAANGWTLLFNSQPDIWGTEHNAAYDILKVPMTTRALNETVQLLTFAIVADNKGGGTISVAWDKLKASAGFTTGQ